MAQLDVGVVGGDLGDDAAPHARGLEHVRLVDRHELAAPAARELERAPRDPLDLQRVVLADVVDRAVLHRPAPAVVQPAEELAHDQQVDAVSDRRAQVRVDVELLAQIDQRLLGALRRAVPLRAADRAEQHGVGAATGLQRVVGQRLAVVVECVAADRLLLEADSKRHQHAVRLKHHFRADPVAGQADEPMRHGAPCA